MTKTDFKNVDEYLATLPEHTQEVLQRVRGIIRKALPDAEETISYQIPGIKQRGASVLAFAGWKQHYSIYPATKRLVEAFGDELSPYVLGKGTIRFPLALPVPVKLIGRIVKFLEQEAHARSAAKAARSVAKAARSKKRQ